MGEGFEKKVFGGVVRRVGKMVRRRIGKRLRRRVDRKVKRRVGKKGLGGEGFGKSVGKYGK